MQGNEIVWTCKRSEREFLQEWVGVVGFCGSGWTPSRFLWEQMGAGCFCESRQARSKKGVWSVFVEVSGSGQFLREKVGVVSFHDSGQMRWSKCSLSVFVSVNVVVRVSEGVGGRGQFHGRWAGIRWVWSVFVAIGRHGQSFYASGWVWSEFLMEQSGRGQSFFWNE